MTQLMNKHPILGYHQITSDTPPERFGDYAISSSQFEWQMDYLYKHGFVCLPLDELLQNSKKGQSPWRRAFALTVDDGYEDFFTVAYPILEKYGFTATVSLVSNLVSDHTESMVFGNNRYLTWEQIKILQQKGITFGSHSVTHSHLPSLDPDLIRRELITSKTQLEAGLGCEVKWFIYPYADTNNEIEKLVEEAGYQAALNGNHGCNSTYNIRRQFCRWDESQRTFIFRLSPLYNDFMRFRDETAIGQSLCKIRRKFLSQEQSR